MLKNSTRNSAPNRSLHLKSLNMEKSTFLKPESRKMFRPIFPKCPATGGVRTELPATKQPACPGAVPKSSTAPAPAAATKAASAAAHLDHMAAEVVASHAPGN